MPIVGLGVFAVIKFFGYYLFFQALNKREKAVNSFKLAAIRLVSGFLTGLAIHFAFKTGRDIFSVYFSALLLSRIAIWYIIFHIHYRPLPVSKRIRYIAIGTAISYIMDIPAALGLFVAVGGIC